VWEAEWRAEVDDTSLFFAADDSHVPPAMLPDLEKADPAP